MISPIASFEIITAVIKDSKIFFGIAASPAAVNPNVLKCF